MKKGYHFILVYAGKGKSEFKWVEGYTHTIDGLDLGFRKLENGWVATDMLTGFSIANGKTRKECVEQATTRIDLVKRSHIMQPEHVENLKEHMRNLGMIVPGEA